MRGREDIRSGSRCKERRRKVTEGDHTTRELSHSCFTLRRSNTQPRCGLTSGCVDARSAQERRERRRAIQEMLEDVCRQLLLHEENPAKARGPMLLQFGAQHVNETREPTHASCCWS